MARYYPKINDCKVCGGSGRIFVDKDTIGDTTITCNHCFGYSQLKLPLDLERTNKCN